MAQIRENLIARLLQRGAIARWAAAARRAKTADLDVLRNQRHRARQIRAHVDELMHVAENRLALLRIGSNAFSRPCGTEWSWRPRLWRGPLARKGMSAVP